jgi:hypothetical protein
LNSPGDFGFSTDGVNFSPGGFTSSNVDFISPANLQTPAATSGFRNYQYRDYDETSRGLSPLFYLSPADFIFNSYALSFFSPGQRFLTPRDLYTSSEVSSDFFGSASTVSASLVMILLGLLVLC